MTVVARLGVALYWLFAGLALLLSGLVLVTWALIWVGYLNPANDEVFMRVVLLILAAALYLFARGCRYVLAGRF